MLRAALTLTLLFALVLTSCVNTQTATDFTVTYDANGATSGTVPVDITTYKSDALVTALDNTGKLVKPGYAFRGWNTKADLSGTAISVDSTFRIKSESVTLYAKWVADGSVVTPPTSNVGDPFVENMSLPQTVRDYYRSAYGLKGAALKTKLQEIIKNSHTPKSYAALWTMYYTSDIVPSGPYSGKVWDMYSSTSSTGESASYWFTIGTDQAGNYSGEGDKYNREHTWPKSTLGGEDVIPGYDGHHITPTDGKVNGMRSNYPYGEVETATWTSLNGSKLGIPKVSLGFTSIDPADGNKVFEMLDMYKGDHARMHFYMALRYYNDPLFILCDWANAGAKLKPWYDTMLDRWGHSDPVSAKEVTRNNAVAAFQGNRNPFIDYPELEDMIDLTQ